MSSEFGKDIEKKTIKLSKNGPILGVKFDKIGYFEYIYVFYVFFILRILYIYKYYII